MSSSESSTASSPNLFGPYRYALIVALAGLFVSFGSFLGVRHWLHARTASSFAELSSDRSHVLQRALNADIRNLRSIGRFLEASPNATREEFGHFVAAEIFQESPDILSVIWAPRIAPSGGNQPERVPVRYAESPDSAWHVLGKDLNADPELRAALARARVAETGAVVALADADAITSPARVHTMSVILPVRAAGLTGVGVAGAVTGYVIQTIGVGAHVKNAVEGLNPAGLDVYVLDRNASAGQRLLYMHSSRTRGESIAGGEDDLVSSSPFHWSTEWNVGGASWEIMTRPAPAFLARYRDWQSPLVLLGGLLFWGLLAGFAASLGRRTAEVERRVREALADVKQLRGLLPMCSYCKKIRDDTAYWHGVEAYIAQHTDAQFSHGICPDCYELHVKPELDGPE